MRQIQTVHARTMKIKGIDKLSIPIKLLIIIVVYTRLMLRVGRYTRGTLISHHANGKPVGYIDELVDIFLKECWSMDV